MSRGAGALGRMLRTPSTEIYAVADLGTARRLGSLMWLLGTGIAAVLLPIAPPTGSGLRRWGWLVAGAVVLGMLAAAQAFRRRETPSPDVLLASGYVVLALVAVLVWLTGSDSPDQELFLLPVLFTAAVHPPRRVLVFALALVALVAAPLIYEGWSSSLAAQTAGRLIVWCALGLVAMAFIARVRTQRLGLVRERREASAQARSDALTGLGNRRALDEALEAAIGRAGRGGRGLSVIVGDIDSFKRINDQWGHVIGDECLQAVARTLERLVRAPDACFRWGGDEFVVVADTELAGAEALSSRVADAVRAECATPDGGPLSIRLGAAQLEPGMNGHELLERADLALLTGKGSATASPP